VKHSTHTPHTLHTLCNGKAPLAKKHLDHVQKPLAFLLSEKSSLLIMTSWLPCKRHHDKLMGAVMHVDTCLRVPSARSRKFLFWRSTFSRSLSHTSSIFCSLRAALVVVEVASAGDGTASVGCRSPLYSAKNHIKPIERENPTR
jgi:hypothetical protein